jgi:hypothetical protein
LSWARKCSTRRGRSSLRARRRDLQHDPAQPVVEIFPERPVLNRHGEVPMGRGDEPHVHAPCLGGSHGPDLAALQEAEEPVIQISEVVVG